MLNERRSDNMLSILIARRKKGLTQEELASEVGTSKQAISYYETGKRIPSSIMLKKLAEKLDVTADYLLKEVE